MMLRRCGSLAHLLDPFVIGALRAAVLSKEAECMQA
jgi:hypothetical protein